MASFKDVKPQERFYNTVIDLANKGIIHGYSDNTYKPQNTVTYAEFLTLLNNAVGEKQTNGATWYESTFNYLRNKRVIDNISNPKAPIPRQEMAKYVSKVLENIKGMKSNYNTPDLKDYNSIEDSYKKYVANAANNRIIVGDENKNFNGTETLTMAESAQGINNLENIGEKTAEKSAEKSVEKPVETNAEINLTDASRPLVWK